MACIPRRAATRVNHVSVALLNAWRPAVSGGSLTCDFDKRNVPRLSNPGMKLKHVAWGWAMLVLSAETLYGSAALNGELRGLKHSLFSARDNRL